MCRINPGTALPAIPVGYAEMRVDDQGVVTLIWFSPLGTASLLGATALETAGLGVDR